MPQPSERIVEWLCTACRAAGSPFDDAVEIWIVWLTTRQFQNRIAAEFDVNPGRINEILTRKRFPEAYEVALKKLKADNDNEPPEGGKPVQLTLV